MHSPMLSSVARIVTAPRGPINYLSGSIYRSVSRACMRACLKPARRAPTRISIFSARLYTLDVFQLTLLPYSWLRPPNVKRSRRLSHEDRFDHAYVRLSRLMDN